MGLAVIRWNSVLGDYKFLKVVRFWLDTKSAIGKFHENWLKEMNSIFFANGYLNIILST